MTMFKGNAWDFGQVDTKTEKAKNFKQNPLAMLISFRESVDDHITIGLMEALAEYPDQQLTEIVFQTHQVPEVLDKHLSAAHDIMQYYGFKYTSAKLQGTTLSPYQKVVMDMRKRFELGNYSITNTEQRALWRLIDFYMTDNHMETIVSENVSAVELPDGEQILDLTCYTVLSLKHKRRGNERALCFLARTADRQLVVFEFSEKDSNVALIRYIFDNHSGLRVGVNRSMLTTLSPGSSGFQALKLTDYTVLKLY
jgi:hypothetical protein